MQTALLLSTCHLYQAALQGAQQLLLSTLLMVSDETVNTVIATHAPILDAIYSPELCVLQ